MIRVKQIVIVGSFDDMRAAAPRIIRRGMIAMVRHWHSKFMPAHFRRGAARVYSYKRRGPTYARQKSRRGKLPLMWKGTTKAQARALFHVTGTATRVRGKFILPSYIRMGTTSRLIKGKHYVLPAVGQELTTIKAREKVVLVKQLRRRTLAALRGIRTRRTIKVG